jgi:DNA invertase Pin-like site-specific DNA recombinase
VPLMGALAEFERDLIRKRTKAGLAAARTRGRVGGRPRKTSDGKVALGRHLYQDSKHSVAEIGSMLEISRSTFFRSVKRSRKLSETQA